MRISRENSSKVQYFLGQIRPLVAFVVDYGPAVDVATNICPELLAPIWAPLKVLLNVRQSTSGFTDSVDLTVIDCGQS